MIQQSSAGASKGFFDSSVGAQFANSSESPKTAAPAPRQSSPTKASSGGDFFDSSVGSQFANRAESPRKAAPKQAAPATSSSGKLFSLPVFHSQNVSRQMSCVWHCKPSRHWIDCNCFELSCLKRTL